MLKYTQIFLVRQTWDLSNRQDRWAAGRLDVWTTLHATEKKHRGSANKTRLACISPGAVQFAINKLPLRPRPEHLHKPLVATPRFYSQENTLHCFTSRRMDSESERSLRGSRDSNRQMRESSTARPRFASDRLRIPQRRTTREKACFKSPSFWRKCSCHCSQPVSETGDWWDWASMGRWENRYCIPTHDSGHEEKW